MEATAAMEEEEDKIAAKEKDEATKVTNVRRENTAGHTATAHMTETPARTRSPDTSKAPRSKTNKVEATRTATRQPDGVGQ